MKLIGYIIRHFIPISLLIVLGVGIYTIATPPPSSRIDGLGIDLLSSPPLTTEAVEGQLNAIQQSGVEYVRIEMNWSLIEASQDVYDWSSVLPLDLFFSSAQARGLKCIAVVTGFPVYLTASGLPLDQQTIGLRWEKFIRAAVEHFGEQVNYWEIGDQINSTNSARSLAQSNPAFYSKMLKAASKIIKNVDPNDQVWMGSLVSATANNCAVNPLSFLLEVNAAKAWNLADAVTYQPRRGATAPEMPSDSDINQGCNASMPASSASLSAEVLSIQDLARQLGGKPVYITGLTWSPDELVSLQGSRAIDANTLLSDLLVRASIILTGADAVPLVFWQVDPINQPQSITSLSDLSASVVNSKSMGQVQGQTGSVHEYRFQNGANLTILAWRSQDGDAPQPVVFSNLRTKYLTAFSTDVLGLDKNYGTIIQVDGTGSSIVMLNERPVIFITKTGTWDEQIKAAVTNQVELWRLDLQALISRGLGNLKGVFTQWLDGLFDQAKDSVVDWGSEKIRDMLN
ncbi:MAG: hypothetical protein CVU42_06800 [Chloroflexi bacterium HGW-Chloroflexi-4]|jgi:hypothetical protein|nr:MAG: hypothetical protein CVU42_06800 [Chloroflexi bacterium HGW-Chloroflexi-4]